jgi:sporulation protein YlmC with PRC-barrel domain
MAGTMPLMIGAEVSCTDGACGKRSRVVVDPAAQTVTHLVVDRQYQGRLVPLGLVDAVTGGLRLGCTIAEFENLQPADTTVLPQERFEDPRWDVLGVASRARLSPPSRPPVTSEALPFGEVAMRGGEPVHATDGDIGQVRGLVIDPASHQVTHVLLREGHVFGRKEVAIPVGAVTAVGEDGIRLNLTKQQVQGLPLLDIDHSGG